MQEITDRRMKLEATVNGPTYPSYSKINKWKWESDLTQAKWRELYLSNIL